jgi:hypothetical protein
MVFIRQLYGFYSSVTSVKGQFMLVNYHLTAIIFNFCLAVLSGLILPDSVNPAAFIVVHVRIKPYCHKIA